MLNTIARLTTRRPKRVLAITFVVLVIAGVFGGPVAGLLSTGDDFADPQSESALAAERLTRAAGAESDPGVIALVRPGAAVESPEARSEVEAVTSELESVPGVAQALSFYSTDDRAFVSRDGRATYVAAFLEAGVDEEVVVEAVEERLGDRESVSLGGTAAGEPEVGEQVSEDLARAELLAFPILFLLSLLVFRGVVAAILPLFVGVLTIFGTFLGLRIANEATLLSIFALNLAIGLGLGLAIDYSLFVVSRYREEAAKHGFGAEAMRRTLATAGRTVLFSSLTVAAALLSLTIFPQRFLYSMGISGTVTALVAAAVSLVALPALLALLGPRVNALAPKRWRRASEGEDELATTGFWYRLSRAVMRRPARVALVTAAALIIAGLPFAGIKFTGVDASVLPEASETRQVDDALRAEFDSDRGSPVSVAVHAPEDERPAVQSYAGDLAALPGVASVQEPRYLTGDGGLWEVELTSEQAALDERTLDLVREVRDMPAPAAADVTGQSAEFVDQQSSLADRLPLGLAVLTLSTLVILFLMTGSVILPVKTLLMNVLSLSAAFGILVLVFQDGRLEGLLDFESQGALEATQPLVLLALAFGLSTDYGVFLLTRIKEARDAGASNDEAVAIGLQRTGRIVTAAALLFTVAIGAFVTSEIIFIKQVGFGTAAAVLIDATIVRALLVPSLMKLLGERNWWAPGPLRRLHRRIGLSEEQPQPA